MHHRDQKSRLRALSGASFAAIAIVGAPALICMLGGTASAQSVISPRAVGMGNAVRADPRNNSALIINPAGMSRDYVYAAQFGYARSNASKANVGQLNVVDSRTQPALAMGVAYGYGFADNNAPVEEGGHDVRVGFSTAPSDRVSIGVALHYLSLTRKDPIEDLNAFTLDAGLLMQLTDQINLGLVGHNIAPTDDPGFPTEVGGGLAFVDQRFTLGVDVVVNVTPERPEGSEEEESPKPRIMAGAEFLLQDSVPLRVGYERDQTQEADFVTGGLGFIMSDKGGGGQINIGYRHNLTVSDDFQLVAGITLFL
ncbi:MAG: hypothetical protein ACE366_07870 [Bradymonadia bacterium]